jgi:hypothetical protein
VQTILITNPVFVLAFRAELALVIAILELAFRTYRALCTALAGVLPFIAHSASDRLLNAGVLAVRARLACRLLIVWLVLTLNAFIAGDLSGRLLELASWARDTAWRIFAIVNAILTCRTRLAMGCAVLGDRAAIARLA